MAEKSVAEQVAELTAKWNPPPVDHTLERVVGVPTEPGDVAATAHVPAEVLNEGFTSPSDSGVDAQRVYEDDLEGDGDVPEFDDVTVDELKDALRDADKPVSGSKRELYDRLYGDDDDDE